MKKLINFLKRSTFIAALCLVVTGAFVPTQIDADPEDSACTYALKDPENDERPIGPGGADQN